MKIAPVLGIVGAVLLHALFLLFGGLIFGREKENHGTTQQVELMSETEAEAEKEKEKERKKEEDAEREKEEIDQEQEKAPDAEEIVRNLELTPMNDGPALEAASLSAIEAALSGQSSSGDFAEALSFNSGGRIGSTGKGGAFDEKFEDAFGLNEIDQKARPIFQTSPLFPAEMRGKKIDGVVTLQLIVDASGKVVNSKVANSTHPAFDKPAIDAVKQWKFEPAVRAGKRVPDKILVSIRFKQS